LQSSEREHNYDVKFLAFKNVVYSTYVKVEEEEEEEEEELRDLWSRRAVQ
jgi:hypothetical protein